MTEKEQIKQSRTYLLDAMSDVINNMHDPAFTIFFDIKTAIQSNSEHYLAQSLDNPSKVSYAAKPDFKFDSERRTRITLGRYIRRHYNECLEKFENPDYELNKFVGCVIARLPGNANFTIISGSDIEDAYENEIGDASCMTGDCAEFTRIYAENPEKVKMLILGDPSKPDKCIGRALVWHTNKGICLDRIYPNSGQHIDLFNRYAEEQGWIIRRHNSAPGNTTFEDEYNIILNAPSNDLFPYMDSFRYAERHGNKIYLSNYHKYGALLNRTDGEFGSDNCTRCGDPITEPIIINGESYCEDCCVYCGYCCDYVNIDYSTVINGNTCCDSCAEDFTECEKCGNFELNDEMERFDNQDWCQECYQEYIDTCDECEDKYYKSDLTYCEETLCEECLEERDKEAQGV